MKRTRSAPRSGAPKRKVLMDDTMVLHGEYVLPHTSDYIRSFNAHIYISTFCRLNSINALTVR